MEGKRSFGGFRRNFGPREMHKATCSDCKNECEVPFKPSEGKPVYCKTCYFKRKDEGRTNRPAQFSESKKPQAEEDKGMSDESDSEEFEDSDDSEEE